ncbi:MAG: ATP-binding cassette domain-containing protein [Sphingobium sp.]
MTLDSGQSAPSESLLGIVWQKLRRGRAIRHGTGTSKGAGTGKGTGGRADGGAPLAPLPFVHALEQLSGACGMPASRAHLTAGLPVSAGDMDHRFAPFALARMGLDARWLNLPLQQARPHDLPALAAVREGGAIIVCAIARGPNDSATIIDAMGERTVPLAMVTASTADMILCCGHLDPENGMDEEAERDLVQRNPRLWLLGTFLAEKRRILQLLGGAILLNLCALAVPLYMRAIYDRVVPNLAIESLWALSVGMVIVLLFEFAFRHVRGGFVDAISVRIGQAIQHRAMSTILNARNTQGGKSVGALMMGLRDVEQVATLAPQAAVTFLVDVPWFLAFLAIILMIGGGAVAGPLIGAAGMLLIGVIANYAVKLASNKSSKLMQARNNLVVEVTEGWSTIKANLAEGQFLRQWDIVSDHIGVGTKAVRRWNDLPGGASTFLVQLVTVLVVIIGVFQIKAGVMTTGALVAVTMLTGRAMVPVSAAVAMVGKVYQSLSQIDGLAQILQMEPERALSDPSIKPHRIRGDIRISNLTHKFEGRADNSLNGVSFTIAPGEKIALIGKSGSGKSTLLQILAGLNETQSGALSIDGHAIDQYASAHLRRGIVYAAQDATLFDRSIWENILLGLPEPDESVVEAAIKASGLDSFVSRTAEGYGRKVGPRGQRLSGGQRQSLILARALVRDPSVLLLDEPTASMDINSEAMVIQGLREVARDKTMIVATHRLALLDMVDRVIWLEDGRVLADKPRAEVLALLRGGANPNAARAA